MSTLMLISATTVVTGGLGFIIGASLRGSVVAGLREEVGRLKAEAVIDDDQLDMLSRANRSVTAKIEAMAIELQCLYQAADAHAADLTAVRRERDALVAAEAKRQAQRVSAAQKAGERSHADGLKRRAEPAQVANAVGVVA